MFAETLSDSLWASQSHRGWSTIASFTAQAVGLVILLLLPYFSNSALPLLSLRPPLSVCSVLPASQHTAPQERSHHLGGVSVVEVSSQWTTPQSVPYRVAMGGDTQNAVAGPLSILNGTGDIRGNAIWKAIGEGFNAVNPLPPPAPKPIRVSRMMEGNLIYRVDPVYPSLARMAHVQGTVVLQAVISKAGSIEKLETVSGHPLLIDAAVNAVRQWRYRPFYLNDEPVEVDTQITVNFTLSQ